MKSVKIGKSVKFTNTNPPCPGMDSKIKDAKHSVSAGPDMVMHT